MSDLENNGEEFTGFENTDRDSREMSKGTTQKAENQLEKENWLQLFARLDQKLDQQNQKLDQQNQKFERLEESLRKHNETHMEEIGKVNNKLDEFKEEMSQHVGKCERKIGELDNKTRATENISRTCETRMERVELKCQEANQMISNAQTEQNKLWERVNMQREKLTENADEIEKCWVEIHEGVRGVEAVEKQIHEIESNLEQNIEKVFCQSPRVGQHLENLREEVKGVKQECNRFCEEKLRQFRRGGGMFNEKGCLTSDEVMAFEKAVPKFYGDNRGATPIQFIHKCERMLNSLGGSEEQQVQLFVNRLGGDALQWASWKETEWEKFGDCRTAFLQKYWGVYVQDDFLQYVFAGRYRNQDGPMANYVQKLHLQTKYLDNGMAEERFISHVIHHLPWTIQNCILGSRPKSVEDVVKLLEVLDRRAEREEGLRRRENENQNRGNGTRQRGERYENRTQQGYQRERRDDGSDQGAGRQDQRGNEHLNQ